MNTKDLINLFKDRYNSVWVQFHVYQIFSIGDQKKQKKNTCDKARKRQKEETH